MKETGPDQSHDRAVVDLEAVRRRQDEIDAEIDAEIRRHGERMDELRSEKAAIALLRSFVDEGRFGPASASCTVSAAARSPSGAKMPKVTQRALIAMALEGQADGASVGHIVRWSAGRVQKPPARTSLSPLLRKMADPGRDEVRHDPQNRKWTLTEAGRRVAEAFRSDWLRAGGGSFWDDQEAADDQAGRSQM